MVFLLSVQGLESRARVDFFLCGGVRGERTKEATEKEFVKSVQADGRHFSPRAPLLLLLPAPHSKTKAEKGAETLYFTVKNLLPAVSLLSLRSWTGTPSSPHARREEGQREEAQREKGQGEKGQREKGQREKAVGVRSESRA